jgi:hypothetical protein
VQSSQSYGKTGSVFPANAGVISGITNWRIDMSNDYRQVKAGEQTVFVAPMNFNGGVMLSINAICGSMHVLLNQKQMQELIEALQSYVAVPEVS